MNESTTRELKTYRGMPIKRMQRDGDDKLRIRFVAPQEGDSGREIVISRTLWDRHGRREFISKDAYPDVRQLAAEFLHIIDQYHS